MTVIRLKLLQKWWTVTCTHYLRETEPHILEGQCYQLVILIWVTWYFRSLRLLSAQCCIYRFSRHTTNLSETRECEELQMLRRMLYRAKERAFANGFWHQGSFAQCVIISWLQIKADNQDFCRSNQARITYIYTCVCEFVWIHTM